MIIQCDKCRTKFRLDDSKVKDKGVKVRCAKCRHIFLVVQEQAAGEQSADFSEILSESMAGSRKDSLPIESSDHFMSLTQESAPAGATDTVTQDDTFDFTESFEPEQPAPAAEAAQAIVPDEARIDDTFDFTESFEPEQPADAAEATQAIVADETRQDDTFDFSEAFEPEPSAIAFESAPKNASADDGSFSLPEVSSDFNSQAGINPDTDEVDFGGLDFGDATFSSDISDEATPSIDFGDAPQEQQPVPKKPVKEEYGGLDFSDDDMFGEVVNQTPEEPVAAISFDFGADGFAESMGAESGSKKSLSSLDSAESAFSLDDIDFGDDLTAVAIRQVNPEELQPSQESLFAPLAEAQSRPVQDSGESLLTSGVATSELPPLSIASRRKQSPLTTLVYALLGVLVLVAVVFFGYSQIGGNKEKGAQDPSAIIIKSVDATFVKSKLSGDLLVISGEAVNGFSKPRAAIQVKGMVYGDDGKILASKNAFCGNPLTPEQLASMPMDKIEAAMANQFGDSLANMEVAPGKSIQFVIVIPKPDKAAKDYGVEPAGSTLAAVK